MKSRFARTRGRARSYRAPSRCRCLVGPIERLESRGLLSTLVARPAIDGSPFVAGRTPTGLTPAQVRRAYGFDAIRFGSVVGDGTGQTIAIVVAYDAPTALADLRKFDRAFGLPDPPRFSRIKLPGVPRVAPGWALETALDVEWAHAVAPRANLLLVEAKSAAIDDLLAAVDVARSQPGVSVISMSWGTAEFPDESSADFHFSTPGRHIAGGGLPGGITFVAATGDSGAWFGPQYPSTSPNVLAVGGTRLALGFAGTYLSETGWSGGGGGVSRFEAQPAYQFEVQQTGARSTPDIALNADPASGYAVYCSIQQPNGVRGWTTLGGTSAAAPQLAAMIAIADQGLALDGHGALGNAQVALYDLSASAFRDVIGGSNGYLAHPGYDGVTGLGSPVAPTLVNGLLSTSSRAVAEAFSTAPRFFVKASVPSAIIPSIRTTPGHPKRKPMHGPHHRLTPAPSNARVRALAFSPTGR